jgi:hypothetical protein
MASPKFSLGMINDAGAAGLSKSRCTYCIRLMTPVRYTKGGVGVSDFPGWSPFGRKYGDRVQP